MGVSADRGHRFSKVPQRAIFWWEGHAVDGDAHAGEAVVYGSGSLPDSQQLRRELDPKRSRRVRYDAFDLLYLDGYDLRGVAYEDRKRLLQHLLKGAPETFIYVEALEAWLAEYSRTKPCCRRPSSASPLQNPPGRTPSVFTDPHKLQNCAVMVGHRLACIAEKHCRATEDGYNPAESFENVQRKHAMNSSLPGANGASSVGP